MYTDTTERLMSLSNKAPKVEGRTKVKVVNGKYEILQMFHVVTENLHDAL